MSAQEVRARSEAISSRLGALVAQSGASTVALFAAIRNEVDLVTTLDPALRARGVTVAYPRVSGRASLTLHVAEPQAMAPAGRYGIPEPAVDSPRLEPEGIDVVVVPGLAFDREGYRLGWGGGFYDALLPRAVRARRVGVCYDFQLVETCPHEARDERVHLVVTDLTEVATTHSTKETSS
jgi:5-formyltetrahydrofolate cyclo-ligase